LQKQTGYFKMLPKTTYCGNLF